MGKRIQAGDQVLVRDYRPNRAGARTPWKSPMSEPALVLKVRGNVLAVRFTNNEQKEVHIERVLVVPKDYEDYEDPRLV